MTHTTFVVSIVVVVTSFIFNIYIRILTVIVATTNIISTITKVTSASMTSVAITLTISVRVIVTLIIGVIAAFVNIIMELSNNKSADLKKGLIEVGQCICLSVVCLADKDFAIGLCWCMTTRDGGKSICRPVFCEC